MRIYEFAKVGVTRWGEPRPVDTELSTHPPGGCKGSSKGFHPLHRVQADEVSVACGSLVGVSDAQTNSEDFSVLLENFVSAIT